jgi:hypothetical protein
MKRFPFFNLVLVLKSAFRWPRGPRSILIISTSVAGTQEKTRLGKPANRATQVRAIYGKDLEILTVHISNPARDVASFFVPGIDPGISVRGETSLARRKLFQLAERKPRIVSALFFASHGLKQVTRNRGKQSRADNPVKPDLLRIECFVPRDTLRIDRRKCVPGEAQASSRSRGRGNQGSKRSQAVRTRRFFAQADCPAVTRFCNLHLEHIRPPRNARLVFHEDILTLISFVYAASTVSAPNS